MRSSGVGPTRHARTVVALAVVAAAIAVSGGIAPSPFRPLSLVTANIVMQGGQPFVRLADLARAMGGSVRLDPARVRYEIQPGAAGVLLVNAGKLATLGGAGAPGGAAPGQAARRNAFGLAIGGHNVAIAEEDRLFLTPADAAVSLRFLARLLGGQPRFDASKGIWLLPAGDAASPLRFR